jgi:hypothetical protein
MKNLNHVRILAKAYAKGEGIDLMAIYETNVPPIGKAYNFEPAAYGRKDFVEVIDVRNNPSPDVLSNDGGRKLPTVGRGKLKAVKKEDVELGGDGAEILGDSGEILSEN